MRRTPLSSSGSRAALTRPLTAVAAAALVAGVLAGCTGTPSAADCDPVLPAGDASKAVTVNGDVDARPAPDYPTPLIAPTPERSVAVAGHGAPVPEGGVALVRVTIADAASDTVLEEPTGFVTARDSFLALGNALVCATEGSRVVVVGSAADVWPRAGVDTVVAVMDVQQVFLGKADGVNQLPLDGMPTVVTAVDGTPGIALAYSPAPEEVRTATIKAGGGAVVEDGDRVVYHGRSWNWPSSSQGSPTIAELDSWTNFQARYLDIDAASSEPVQQALLGAKVGSQLLVVVPGADNRPATIVVIDILGIVQE